MIRSRGPKGNPSQAQIYLTLTYNVLYSHWTESNTVHKHFLCRRRRHHHHHHQQQQQRQQRQDHHKCQLAYRSFTDPPRSAWLWFGPVGTLI